MACGNKNSCLGRQCANRNRLDMQMSSFTSSMPIMVGSGLMPLQALQAGIQAAKRGGMSVIGIGSEDQLKGGNRVVPNFLEINLPFLQGVYNS